MIEIVPYDAGWPQRFESEAESLRQVLGALALRIEHVGSTAVPGLAAKPVIDLQISVDSLQPAARFPPLLARIDYEFIPLGDFDLVYPFFQKPPAWPSQFHVHLCQSGSEQERRHLAFRDYLRANPDSAANYEDLKRALARLHSGDSLASRERYSLAKSDFVNDVLRRAGQAPRGR